jgi:hypothetical protein
MEASRVFVAVVGRAGGKADSHQASNLVRIFGWPVEDFVEACQLRSSLTRCRLFRSGGLDRNSINVFGVIGAVVVIENRGNIWSGFRLSPSCFVLNDGLVLLLLEEVIGQAVVLKERLDGRSSKNWFQDGDQSKNYHKTG